MFAYKRAPCLTTNLVTFNGLNILKHSQHDSMVTVKGALASQMKPIAAVIHCHFNLIMKRKTIGFEHTEHWRFEDNCDEMILPKKLVTVHDFYCVPVSAKNRTVKPTLNMATNPRRCACAFELVS